MDEFVKMDIFFFVTTIAVVILSILIAVVLIYAIRILRKADHLTDEVSEEAKLVRGDIADFRASVRSEGLKWKSVSSLAKATIQRFFRKKEHNR